MTKIPLREGIHPSIAANIAQSERDGGVFLADVAVGSRVEAQTRNTRYVITKRGESDYTIEGNARFCPVPVKAFIAGSTWSGSMLKMGFIGVGMRLEFSTEEHPAILTTAIVSVVVIAGHAEGR